METVIFLFILLFIVFFVISKVETRNRSGKHSHSGGDNFKTFMTGRNGRNWLYEEKLHDDRWKEKRNKILERDGYKCQWCGSEHSLQVHHKRYDKFPNGEMVEPWDYPDKCLITLCGDCHRKYHEKYTVHTFYRKYGEHYQ